MDINEASTHDLEAELNKRKAQEKSRHEAANRLFSRSTVLAGDKLSALAERDAAIEEAAALTDKLRFVTEERDAALKRCELLRDLADHSAAEEGHSARRMMQAQASRTKIAQEFAEVRRERDEALLKLQAATATTAPDPDYDVFIGPCAHGYDPYDRCDYCGTLSAQDAKANANALKDN